MAAQRKAGCRETAPGFLLYGPQRGPSHGDQRRQRYAFIPTAGPGRTKNRTPPDPPHSHPHTGTNPRHESGCSRVRARTARQIRRQTRTPGHRGIGASGHRYGHKKNGTNPFQGSSRSFVGPGPDGCYIMPPMPPAGIAGTAGCSDFFSASTHSVVRNIEAIDAAFSSATRDTFVGSMIPAASMSS